MLTRAVRRWYGSPAKRDVCGIRRLSVLPKVLLAYIFVRNGGTMITEPAYQGGRPRVVRLCPTHDR